MDFPSANFLPPKKSWNVVVPVKRNESLIRTSKARGERDAGPWYIKALDSFNSVLNYMCKGASSPVGFRQVLKETRVYPSHLIIECLGIWEYFLFLNGTCGRHFCVNSSNKDLEGILQTKLYAHRGPGKWPHSSAKVVTKLGQVQVSVSLCPRKIVGLEL